MTTKKKPSLLVELAKNNDDIRASQRLRYQIFGEEMGAELHSPEAGLDIDYYDQYCQHLLVRNTETGEIVGSTRILTEDQARIAGGFYSQNEFDLNNLLPLPGRVMEMGRTCVHRDYRSGGAIMVLWSGLARFMIENHIDYMMGCASIPMDDGGLLVRNIMNRVRDKHYAPDERRTTPRHPLPENTHGVDIKIPEPPLLKAYLRVGVEVCGEPCYDPDFNCADVFVLLDMNRLDSRYRQYFIKEDEKPLVAGNSLHATHH